ncbi:ASCH domain-containing protein [Pseudomonas chlororaphis]|uniref:ASCH domain-containing protein n=1 Tax=Pseudomonas chlororaphis TaxID=587753 RepID=UPI0023664BD8|nr:ASCH domain-containing protein [Pseudomonas chlororaphis]WDG52442.1 ASCH domain-containing protein [Pseudomonas chlororaphis]WDH86541.1 ASCH domain-containing protein [Pseudomonas chlororaphis]
MKALSIRQPWAWLIVHGGKDIENRSWHTKFRGRFMVHAAKGMTVRQWVAAIDFCIAQGIHDTPFDMPAFEDLQRGGIIGSVELVDSLDTSESPWYMGQKGFLLRDPKPLPFTPLKGRLGFFEVPAELAKQ